MKLLNFHILCLAALVAGLSSCKKDSDEPTPTPPSNNEETPVHATVRLQFSFMQNDTTYTLDSLLHDSLGHEFKLDAIRFYVSGIHAINDEEEVIGHYEANNILVDPATADTFYMGSIYASHIHEFLFDLGVQDSTNHAAFGIAGAPLNIPEMYWDQTNGYKFMEITGHANLDANPDLETPISFTCGTDALLTAAHAHVHQDLTEGEHFTGHILVDMGTLFTGIDLATTPTGTMGAPVCARLMSNLDLAIDGME